MLRIKLHLFNHGHIISSYKNMKIYIVSCDGLLLRHQFDIVITAEKGLDFQMNKEEQVLHFYDVQQAAEQTLQGTTMA